MAIAYQGTKTEDEQFFRQVIRIAEPFAKAHDADLVLMPLGNLALMQMDQGDYSAVESTARHQVALSRKYIDEISPDTALALKTLGVVLQRLGKHEEAV